MTDARVVIAEQLQDELVGAAVDRADARAYIELLVGGPKDAAAIPTAVQRRLISEGLVGTKEGRRLLYAVEPYGYWKSKVAALVWLRAPHLALIEELGELDDPDLEQLRRRYDRIGALAQRLFLAQDGLPKKLPVSTKDPNVLATLTAEAILTARREIVAASRSPRLPSVALIWRALTDRIGDGVSYRRIADLPEILDHGLSVIRRDVYGVGVRLRVVENARIPRTWYVTDTKYLVVQDTLQPGSTWTNIGGTVSVHRGQLLRYRSNFEKLWSMAVDARSVVATLAEEARPLIAKARRLGDEGQAWIKDIVRWGKFANYPIRQGWSKPMYAEMAARAVDLELIRINADRQPLPRYTLGEELIESLRATPAPIIEELCTVCWERDTDCAHAES